MYRSLKKRISYNLQSIIGWRSNKKILVIESDDWGSIRMPSKKAYNNLLNQGIKVDKCPYNRLDQLEGESDMLALFELLEQIKDAEGNGLKITANMIMANPDFDQIKKNDFTDYHYIGLKETYNHYNGDTKVLELIKEGMVNNVFIPQLHGREHLQPLKWLKALQEKDAETLTAFEQEVWGHPSTYFKNSKQNFSSAFHINESEEKVFMNQAILESGKLFQKEFGYKSKSFIAPRYIWNDDVEKSLKAIGVKYLQGKIVQLKPSTKNKSAWQNKYNYLGKRNKFDQLYLIRNVFFEPSQNPDFDWVSDALNRIRIAYRWGKPAVISMHRINFMGGLEEQNRTTNLMLLKKLIEQVQQEFPEVVFMSSDKLGKLIENE